MKLKYEDDQPVDGKVVGRKVIDKLQQTYHSELSNKDFAYDGEKSLFTVGALPLVNHECTVVLEEPSTGKLVSFLDLFSFFFLPTHNCNLYCHIFLKLFAVVGLLPMGALKGMTVLEMLTGRE